MNNSNNDSKQQDLSEVQIRDDDKVSLKDIRDTFYRCRDFELTQFWQRSVFLTAFIVLCFTGYGYLMSKYLDDLQNFEDAHFYCPFVTIVSAIGLLFSYIWLWMARGSKAWYEVYESAITKIEKEPELNVRSGYRMGDYTDVLDNICSVKKCLGLANGPFSPSKINILIGILLIVFWGINYTFFLYKSTCNYELSCCFCFFITIMIIAICICKCGVKSSHLKDRK